MTTTNESYEALLVQVAEAWPELQVPCPSESHDPCSREFAYTVQGMSYYEQIDIPSCQGHGWLPCRDRDALEAAARERGLGISFYTDGDNDVLGWGDDVTIFSIDDSAVIGEIHHREGLRGTHALVLAVSRALEAAAGLEVEANVE